MIWIVVDVLQYITFWVFSQSNLNSMYSILNRGNTHWRQVLEMATRYMYTNYDLEQVSSIHMNLRHYSDVTMSAMASQITGVSIVCSTTCLGTDQRKHQSSASLAFWRKSHLWPVDSPREGPVMRKIFPFDDVIMVMEHVCHQPVLELLSWYPVR